MTNSELRALAEKARDAEAAFEHYVTTTDRSIDGRGLGLAAHNAEHAFDRACTPTRILELLDANAAMVAALRWIAAPQDCGCVPCRGQCRSEIALQADIDGRREAAEAALALAEKQP